MSESDLDFVEVLSSIEGHNVVGGDADDGLVSGVLGPVKGQSRLSWNYLEKYCTQILSSMMSITLVYSASKWHVWYYIHTAEAIIDLVQGRCVFFLPSPKKHSKTKSKQ